jgi:hypothetical protein
LEKALILEALIVDGIWDNWKYPNYQIKLEYDWEEQRLRERQKMWAQRDARREKLNKEKVELEQN